MEAGATAGVRSQTCRITEGLLCLAGRFPSELECGQQRTGPRSADDRTPHGMAGNRWLARCRPAVTLKASEGKTSKKCLKPVTVQQSDAAGVL